MRQAFWVGAELRFMECLRLQVLDVGFEPQQTGASHDRQEKALAICYFIQPPYSGQEPQHHCEKKCSRTSTHLSGNARMAVKQVS